MDLRNAERLHREAMKLAEWADEERRAGREAVALVRAAMLLEAEAARRVPAGTEPSRSVLYRSAASLAAEAGEWQEARNLALEGLRGNPPEEIRRELEAFVGPDPAQQEDSRMPVLHVYGQAIWHDDVLIMGNTEALRALREAIDRALANDSGGFAKADVTAADGEWYWVMVLRNDHDWRAPEWQNAALPYTDEAARAANDQPGVYWPHEECYKRLNTAQQRFNQDKK